MSTETIKITCGIIATVISIISFFPYWKDILKKKTQPHSYTWLIWTILQVTGVIVMFNTGAGIGVLALAVGAFVCGSVFILSLKYGTKNITPFDTACLIGALASTAIYVFLHDPVLSVILLAITDFVGFLPTLRKAYIEPYSETFSLYVLGIIWSTLNMVAIVTYSLTTVLYPACILFANIICASVIWFRRKRIPIAH